MEGDGKRARKLVPNAIATKSELRRVDEKTLEQATKVQAQAKTHWTQALKY